MKSLEILIVFVISAVVASNVGKTKRGVLHHSDVNDNGYLDVPPAAQHGATLPLEKEVLSSGPVIDDIGPALAEGSSFGGGDFSDHGFSGSGGGAGFGGSSFRSRSTVFLGRIINRHIHVVNRVGFPVPQPVPVEVERRIPVKVPHFVKVPVDRPYPVPVPVKVPVKIYKDFPVPVEKPVPVPVKQHVKVLIHEPVKVVHFKPVPVHIEKEVPVPIPEPIIVKRPVPVQVHAHLSPIDDRYTYANGYEHDQYHHH